MIALSVVLLMAQGSSLKPNEIYEPGYLDYRNTISINRILRTQKPPEEILVAISNRNWKLAHQRLIEKVKKQTFTVYDVKQLIDVNRKLMSYADSFREIVSAMNNNEKTFIASYKADTDFAINNARCYVSAFFSEVVLSGGSIDPKRSQELSCDFSKLQFRGNIKNDLEVVAIGTHGLGGDVRSILKKCMAAYPDEPFFFGCAAQEYTSGEILGDEKTFRPGRGPDYGYVEKISLDGIKKWPKYRVFYIYASLMKKQKKEYTSALEYALKLRALYIDQRGLSHKNLNIYIDQLRELKKAT